MAPQVNWCGTNDQLLELTAVVNRNCACADTSRVVPRKVCGAHRMLMQDQRALDGLLFARHIAGRLRTEEFFATPPTSMSRSQPRAQRGTACQRQHRQPMSIPVGVALIAIGFGVLVLQYAWLVFGISRGCLTRGEGMACFALAHPDLVVMWPIVGLVLLACGLSLIGMEYFCRRPPVQHTALPTTGSVRDHQPSGSRTFAS